MSMRKVLPLSLRRAVLGRVLPRVALSESLTRGYHQATPLGFWNRWGHSVRIEGRK